ncbi:LOW QUALITY PROTEIN: hypothetical protein V2J09_023077 [Rumex salicifolius]
MICEDFKEEFPGSNLVDKVCSNGGGAAGKTLFERVYGRAPPSLKQHLPGDFIVATVAEEFWNRDVVLRQLKYNLDRDQKRITNSSNIKRRDLEFKEGELVFIKLRPHRQKSLLGRLDQKLAARYFGPFQIIRRVGVVAYKLRLLDNTKIYPPHVLIEEGDHRALVELPTELIWKEEEHQLWIFWRYRSQIARRELFPGSNLVDKVRSNGGDIVIVDGYIIYGRKKKRVTKPDQQG